MKLAIFSVSFVYEGFGIPILEAFAVGTPVVASAFAAQGNFGRRRRCFSILTILTTGGKNYRCHNDNNLRESLIQRTRASEKFFLEKNGGKNAGILKI